MKKLFSLIALVATLGLSAQQSTQQMLQQGMAAVQAGQIMTDNNISQLTVVGNGPAVSPRNPSPPASAARSAANNGIPTLKNKGDKITMADGKVYVLCEDGDLHEVGEILTDAQGNRFKVMSDGSIEFISGPPPANTNTNNGPATAGLTLVAPLDAYYDTLSGGRVIFAGDLKMAGPASGGSATTTSGGGSGDPLMSKKLAPNELVYDQQGNTVMLPISLMKLMIRRGYDLQDLSPTDATVAWMENRNGGLGRTLGVTSVVSASVASCGQTVVYNQRPGGAVATYGTRGGDCWRPSWRR